MNRRRFLAGLAAFSVTARKPFLVPQDKTPALSRLPYIQNVRSDRASILWATDDPDTGIAEYSTDRVHFDGVRAAARTFTVGETGLLDPFTQYRADFSGLRPGTTYFYRVSVIGTPSILAQGRFRTASAGPFKFLVMGDSGQRTSAQFLIANRFASEENTDFLLHVGDIAYFHGSHTDFKLNHFDVYNSVLSSIPYFPCPGNHEYEQPGAGPYLALHAVPTENVPPPDYGRYYSFDWGNVHFMCLDSNTSLQRAVAGDGEMLRWLERDLRATRQFWRVAAIHHNPYAGGPNQDDILSLFVRTSVVPILEKHGVQLVLSGHEHNYQRSYSLRNGFVVSPNTGTLYMTTGGGGADLYLVPGRPQIAFARSINHYLTVEVNGASLRLSAIASTGVIVDTTTLSPLPSVDDSGVSPVSVTPLGAGSLVRILGRSLAPEERFMSGPSLPDQTAAAIDGTPLLLLYVSSTQIWARSATPIQPPFVLKLTNPNGFTETTIR